MNKDQLLTGVILEKISVVELCHQYDISKELLLEMIDEGLLSLESSAPEKIDLDEKTAHRIEVGLRLHKDLHINVAGVVLALDLLEELEALQRELDILRKHF